MNRPVIKLWLASILVMSASVPGLAQPEQDVAHWLDRDVTMLFDIRDVATTYEKIKSLDLFRNPRLIKAVEMLSDERFPIVGVENAEQIRLRLLEMEALIGDIKQVSFVVHDLNDKKFHWTFCIRAEPDVLDTIEREMLGIDEQLERSTQPDDKNQPKPESNDNANDPGSVDLKWGKMKRVEGWMVLSNHLPFLDALADRIGNESFRSLGNSRKYLAIRKNKSPLNDREGLITIYGNPVRLHYFFPSITDEQWALMKIDQMPACGLNVVITDPSVDDPSQPILIADAIVKFTQPAAGQAKAYQFYRSVEIPPLAIEPIELLAFSRDEAAVYAESARLFDAQHGPGAAETTWSNPFKEIGLDYLADVIPRREAFYEMRFINEKQSADRPGLVSMERLRDRDAAHRFVECVTRIANERHDQKLTRQEEGPDVGWTIPAERIDPNSGLNGFDRARNSNVDFYNLLHDAYLLSNDWWVQGDMPVVEEQARLLTGKEAEDHGQPIRTLVQDLKRRLGADDEPFMIQYFTKDSWQENLNHVEQQYANANMHAVDLQFEFSQLNGNTIILGVDPDSKDSDGLERGSFPGGGTFQLQLEGVPTESPEKKEPSQQRFNLNMSKLRFMMPMKLLDRNEDGHRIDLKRREDLETAIRVMILKSVSESFPRQLLLFTRNENHIRVLMGAYPEIVQKDDE